MDAPQMRGTVLEFRRPSPPQNSSRGYRGVMRRPVPPASGEDQAINADWDLLIRVSSHAWTWRDPESLGTLEETVARLRQWIERDWSA
jgi:hypothetical protein